MSVTPEIQGDDLYKMIIDTQLGENNTEPAFYYHSDHLGSASYVTASNGAVVQTLNYLPYGEDWVDLQNFNVMPQGYNLGVYKYNGKEKDAETGYHYYGARYYDSEKIGWLSVDPLADKYPSLSPYVYCANNPVILVDPDGKEFGDYYDKYGTYLGHDGINDNKVYKLKNDYCANFKNTNVNWGGTLNKEHYTELRAKSDYLGFVQDAFITRDIISNKRIQGLHPAIRMKVTDFINEANAASNSAFIRVSQGFRTYEEQDALYAQGRTTHGNKVTNAKGGYSIHNYGLAFDIAGIKNGKLNYDLDWTYLSKLGKSKGFEWGGDWKFKDKPHFENTFGRKLKELRLLPKNNEGFPILKP